MFKNLVEFFENTINARGDQQEQGNVSLELAAAVLMIEISMADSHFGDDEHRIIETILHDEFNIGTAEIDSLISIAKQEVDHAVSLHDFTRLINELLSQGEKVKLVEMLWHVAFADTVLDKYEEYYIRKIADLLYVSHSDYIKAKHRASD